MTDTGQAATATTGMARLKAFPRAFWVINGIELFERGAYYSLSAVFTVFLAATFREAGMPASVAAARAGLIWSGLFFLLYILPVLSASFSERIGYKRALVLVFGLVFAGYGAALLATQVPSPTVDVALVLGTVVLLGLGAGIFKPIAAALVAQTSTSEQRNFAFSIYYACINIGAFVFPLSVGLAAAAFPQNQALIAFSVALVLSTINLVLSIFVWRNVREPQREIDLLQGVKRLGEVFKYPAFLVLMVIYAGFWFMYAQSLTFITAYMGDFGRMPGWFNESMQQSINPLVIIAFTPLLGLFTHRFSSLWLMIVGILVYAVGFVVIGFTGTMYLFVGGILVFSVGELLTHPSYLSYVSKIAPPGKESLFLGYGFIPIAVGLTLGSSIGGSLYGTYALEQGKPQLYWAIIACVGLVSVAALVLYNRAIAPKPKDAAPGPARASRRVTGAAGALALAAAILLLVPAVLGGAALAPVLRATPGAGSDGGPLEAASLGTVKLEDVTGAAKNGQPIDETITLPDNASGMATFTLTWKDEAPANPGETNKPDTMTVEVKLPNGTIVTSEPTPNKSNGEGAIELQVPAAPGAYTVTITVQAQGSTVSFGPIALPQDTTPDTGNAWTLGVETQATA